MSTEQTEQSASLVEIQLVDCAAPEAAAVFAVLRAAFPRSPQLGNGQERAGAGGAGKRKIWLGTVDVRTHGEVECAVDLQEPTEADISGTPDAVRQVKDVLAGFFDVRAEPRISGDQEVEVRLHLARR
ncbi:MAG TPA: hypothetical protein VFY14_03910 [Streptomyces sp.]|nr:hypothetical protein [Streptomyces sp.]